MSFQSVYKSKGWFEQNTSVPYLIHLAVQGENTNSMMLIWGLHLAYSCGLRIIIAQWEQTNHSEKCTKHRH